MIALRKLMRMPLKTAAQRCVQELDDLLQGDLDKADRAYVQDLLKWLESSGLIPSGELDLSASEVTFELDSVRHSLLRWLQNEPADWDMRSPAGAKGIFAGPKQDSPLQNMSIYLDAIRSPFNVGSIIRTADAAGVHEVILSPQSVSPDHPRARRSAMGAKVKIRCLDYAQLRNEMETLIALETGGMPVSKYQLPAGKSALILGSEEMGVHPRLMDLVDVCVSLPMYGEKLSLNVGVAAGAAVYTLLSNSAAL